MLQKRLSALLLTISWMMIIPSAATDVEGIGETEDTVNIPQKEDQQENETEENSGNEPQNPAIPEGVDEKEPALETPEEGQSLDHSLDQPMDQSLDQPMDQSLDESQDQNQAPPEVDKNPDAPTLDQPMDQSLDESQDQNQAPPEVDKNPDAPPEKEAVLQPVDNSSEGDQNSDTVYHVSPDQTGQLVAWLNNPEAAPSQEMLDAADQLFNICELLKKIDVEAAKAFEERVQDKNNDLQASLKDGQALLLKTLEERNNQIAEAEAEIKSASTLLKYLDPENFKDVSKITGNPATDPRTQTKGTYDLLIAALKKSAQKSAQE
jgi:hypothetical protein